MNTPRYITSLAAHLNAPYGPVVMPADLEKALSEGTLKGLEKRPGAKALITKLFTECDVDTIGWASVRYGGVKAANALYEELVMAGEPRNPQWETAVKDQL